MNNMIKKGEMRTSWEQMNRDMITNDAIQNIKVLAGEQYLHHDQADQISKLTKEFISQYIPSGEDTPGGKPKPVPKTGDPAEPLLWAGLALLGLLGAGGALLPRRGCRKREK